MKTVEIMQHDDGTFMVGEKPAGDGLPLEAENTMAGGEGAGMEHMQPVGTIDEALEMARNILTGPSEEQAEQDQADFEDGYKGVVGKPEKKSGSMMM